MLSQESQGEAPKTAGGEGELDFAALLEKYTPDEDVRVGKIVHGRIVRLLDDFVLVDIGFKKEGAVPRDDIVRAGEDPSTLEVGGDIEAVVESLDDDEDYIPLSVERAHRIRMWERVEQAYKNGEVITGKVVDRIKGGLAVDLGGARAFLPGSLVDIRPVRNLESYRDEEVRVRVIKMNRRRGNIVVSRKHVLEEENAEKKKETLETLEEGSVVKGVVKNITEYGAFVDLGGIDGLLHVTDMSWGRVNHPSEVVSIGQEVEVKVLKFDREKERVSLGMKQLREDPWKNAAEKYPLLSRIRGKVVSLTDYGAFVELEEGIEGLIHVSEMSWTKRVKHPSKILEVGDEVEAVVLEVDEENRRLSLGLKQTTPNPWSVIEQRYREGDVIKGVVRNIADFGAFVEVEEGVDGLVHISDLTWNRRVKHPAEVLKKGQEVEARILKIDTENQRLSLSIKDLQPDVWEEFFKRYRVGDILEGKIVRLTDFGAFVELSEGVEGLVHVSEMAHERVEKPSDRFQVGQTVRVKILRTEPEERRIGLSIKAALDELGDKDLETYTSEREAEASRSSITLGDVAGDLSALRDRAAARQAGEDAEPDADGADAADDASGQDADGGSGEERSDG
ncbi:MAG: 30S ribosomal protein S1 [Acidobacteria bacterium]|nr:MAG: 30S ribosomal protein S1 [Acidobacteriota bacterium]